MNEPVYSLMINFNEAAMLYTLSARHTVALDALIKQAEENDYSRIEQLKRARQTTVRLKELSNDAMKRLE